MVWLVLILLTLIVWLDVKIWRVNLTPISISLVPLIGVVVLSELMGWRFGFLPISMYSATYILISSACSLTVSMIVRHFSGGVKDVIPYSGVSERVVQICWAISLVISYVYIWKVFSSAGGLTNLGEDRLKDLYDGGIAGHLRVFQMFMFAYSLVFVKKVSKKTLILAAMSALLFVIYPVKGWVLIGLITPWVGRRVLYGGEVAIRQVAVVLAVGVLVFFAVYLVGAGLFTGEVSLVFLREVAIHFLKYLFAGVLGFSGMVSGPVGEGESGALLAPLVNVIHACMGLAYVEIISPYWYPTNCHISEGTNVFTFWGTLYQYGGFVGGLAACSIIHVILYIFLSIRKNVEFVVLYSMLLMAMSFAWFEYYYWHLYFYECTVFAVLFWAVNRLFGSGNGVKKGEGP